MSQQSQTCPPIYRPSHGDEDHQRHSVNANSQCGQLRSDFGRFIARQQIEGFSKGQWKSAKTYLEACAIWKLMCERYHDHGDDDEPPSPVESPPPSPTPGPARQAPFKAWVPASTGQTGVSTGQIHRPPLLVREPHRPLCRSQRLRLPEPHLRLLSPSHNPASQSSRQNGTQASGRWGDTLWGIEGVLLLFEDRYEREGYCDPDWGYLVVRLSQISGVSSPRGARIPATYEQAVCLPNRNGGIFREFRMCERRVDKLMDVLEHRDKEVMSRQCLPGAGSSPGGGTGMGGIEKGSALVCSLENDLKGTCQKKREEKRTDWVGQRLEFMEDFYPTYSDASKRGKMRDIWTKAFVRYWADFPWRLPLTQDPNPDDPTDYGLAPQTPEEEAERKKVHNHYRSRVVLARKKNRAGLKSNPWAEWLTRFRTPAGPVPKKRADFQYYMRLDEYKGKVAEWF
ncbi:hypothetical protein B0H14DRAFT_2587087 [Mycena olivaceomarginata]|nr:hypothetical protein B0H14DRAFT_2587087 [Mycena olivaceomarginata]